MEQSGRKLGKEPKYTGDIPILPSGAGEGDGEPRIIKKKWKAALTYYIRSAAFVFPALPLKGNPATSRQVKSVPTFPLFPFGAWRQVACP